MIYIFGDKQTFAIQSRFIGEENGFKFIHVNLVIGGKEVGDFNEVVTAGPVVYSGGFFLRYTGLRSLEIEDERDAFEWIWQKIYIDEWQVEFSDLICRFAVHAIFDVSVGDYGWLVFLVDRGDQSSAILLGHHESGFERSINIPRGEVERCLKDFDIWIEGLVQQ